MTNESHSITKGKGQNALAIGFFVTGLGHLYIGRYKRGFGIIACVVALAFSMYYLFEAGSGGVVVACLTVWIASFVDLWLIVKKATQGVQL